MIKAKKMVDYRILYSVLVSKFIEHFCVSLENEFVEIVKPHNEVIAVTLHKFHLKKINSAY